MATAKRKRSTTSSTRRRSNNRGGSKFAYYAVLLIIGAAAIVFYDRYITPLPLLSTHTQKAVATHSKPKSAFVEPDYQFYTLLPQGNDTQKAAVTTPVTTKSAAATTPAVAAKAESATPTAPAPSVTKTPAPITAATPTVVTPPNHHYILQLAAFRRYQDADELKAKLILQGYPTTISSATVNGTQWYRLSIGSYTTIADAKIVQAKLEQTHLVRHTQVIPQ